ncbi:MAG: histidine kinase [Eubacterium sp.]|nr:histidine kinase [Eubacterium sp.]
MRRVRNLSIRDKILYGSYLIIIPVLLLIGLVMTGFSYSAAQSSYTGQQVSSAENLASSLRILFQDVNDLSLSIATNSAVLDILHSNQSDELNLDSELWVHRTSVQMIEDIVALKGYVKTMSVYPENGVVPYLRCMDSSAYIFDLSEIRKSKEYKDTIAHRGKGLWVKCSRGKGTLFEANREDKLVLCRGVWDAERKNQVGFLTIGVAEQEIRKLCENAVEEKDEGILLLNATGEMIVSYGKEVKGAAEYIAEQEFLGQEKCRGSFNGTEIYGYEILPENCYVYKTVRKRTFLDFFCDIVYLPLLFAAGIILGLLPVLLFVSSLVSEPMGKVCAAMVQFRQGDFDQRLEVVSGDEIGQVAEGFNQMVAHIKELIDKNYIMALKERESELALLQAQINPHFLYNALDSIYWQAVNADDEDTAESIYGLSQLFRLVLSQGNQFVTVEMETELVERYLEIQKMRFLRQMEYEIQVEPEVLYEKIPKLILQPFVENAVVHGIEKKDMVCTICVTAKWEGNGILFQICDTGAGMSAEQLESIWEQGSDQKFSGQRIGGYAVKNIRQRLKLVYGGAYRLDIQSEEGKGTTVTIYIPGEEKEEEHGT